MTNNDKQNAIENNTLDIPPPIPNVEFKAALLLVVMVVLMFAAIIYLMIARGAFEPVQKLVLVANDSEGIVIGTDVTFSGFPIGRVSRIELTEQGKAKMLVDVPKKEAKWLRSSSIFTMDRGLVGGTRLRAFSGIMSDPPLPEGAERNLLVGDTAAEIPLLIIAAKELLQNINALTASDSSLDHTLRNVKSVTEKMAGKNGAIGVLAGSDENAKSIFLMIEKINQLLKTIDGLASKADTQVFGKHGAMPEAHAALVQLNGLLADTRTSLKKVDAVLVEAQAVGNNLKTATNDLGPLRADVESNLRKVEQLVNEINRKWPFKSDAEVKLP